MPIGNLGSELRRLVIRPTLDYLHIDEAGAENILAALALLSGNFRGGGDGLGLYGITPQQHRRLWDGYLAFHPDLASEIRGLASQRCFLQDPDRELVTNLAYATAVAWLLVSTSGLPLPAPGDSEGLVQLWRQLLGAARTAPSHHQVVDWLRQQLSHAA